jgi:N5-(carboxyethyl)ornithine synthase
MPIHPDHLARIPEHIRKQMVFEEGYGKPFGVSDSSIAQMSGGIASRSQLLCSSKVVILTKPVPADLQELPEGGILWGYPHCVQQRPMVQIAIERKQTLIAFEDMFVWGPNGEAGRHTFYKNNEMAGYCAVLHAVQLKGIDGHYGNQRKVVIFSFGAVSRGAVYALKAHGFRNITICIQRPSCEVREEVLDCEYMTILPGKEEEARMVVVEHDGSRRPLCDLISESDIIINGTAQNPNDPIDYVIQEEADFLKPGSLIIDISCDEGMGFYFAKPTSFKEPMFRVKTVDYYAVDHTPNYLWESATRSISAALIVHLEAVMAGPKEWHKDETIRHAVNIQAGVIQKSDILLFQNRQSTYPHLPVNAF